MGSVRGSSDVCHFAVGIDPKPLWSRGFLRSVGVFVCALLFVFYGGWSFGV